MMAVLGIAGMQACGSGEGGTGTKAVPEGTAMFGPFVGIDYYEVRRTFDTGISYDTIGFVQLPDWHVRFAKPDSILIYSPYEDRMLGYKVYHDHESYFHFARDSWRVVGLHPDSITLQRLSLNGLKVNKIKSNVYMKFYSGSYIRKHIATGAQNDGGQPGTGKLSVADQIAPLRQPSRQDTAFVRERAARANRNPTVPDSAFASRNFAVLESKNPAVTVRKRKIENIDLTEKSPAYEYLYPEYTIRIDRAYKDFSHDFSVIVDEQGKLHLGKVFVMEEFLEARTKVVQGIIDVYLHNWLSITPAHTLGIPHASVVYIYVRGRTDDI